MLKSKTLWASVTAIIGAKVAGRNLHVISLHIFIKKIDISSLSRAQAS